MPLPNPRRLQGEWGVLNTGPTKRTPVTYNGSSQECLRRLGRGPPMTPGGRGTIGFELWASCQQERGSRSSGAKQDIPRGMHPLAPG